MGLEYLRSRIFHSALIEWGPGISTQHPGLRFAPIQFVYSISDKIISFDFTVNTVDAVGQVTIKSIGSYYS